MKAIKSSGWAGSRRASGSRELPEQSSPHLRCRLPGTVQAGASVAGGVCPTLPAPTVCTSQDSTGWGIRGRWGVPRQIGAQQLTAEAAAVLFPPPTHNGGHLPRVRGHRGEGAGRCRLGELLPIGPGPYSCLVLAPASPAAGALTFEVLSEALSVQIRCRLACSRLPASACPRCLCWTRDGMGAPAGSRGGPGPAWGPALECRAGALVGAREG